MNLPAPISATVEMNAGPDEVWRVVSDVVVSDERPSTTTSVESS